MVVGEFVVTTDDFSVVVVLIEVVEVVVVFVVGVVVVGGSGPVPNIDFLKGTESENNLFIMRIWG